MNYDKENGENKVTRISVQYQRGDYGGRRGIVVRFDDIELIRRGNYVIERGFPMDGMNVFCEEMKRANAKILKKWEDGIERVKDVLFAYWAQGKREAICNILTSI